MKFVSVWLFIAFLLSGFPFSTLAQEDSIPQKITLTEDGTFGAILPEGWLMAGNRTDGLTLATNETLLTEITGSFGTPPASGEAYIQILNTTRAELEEGVEGAADMTEVELLQSLIVFFAGSSFTLGSVEEIEWAGRTAGYLLASSGEIDVAYLMVEIGLETLAFTGIVTASGEYETQRQELWDIVASVEFSLELTEAYSSEDETIHFKYPENWVTDKISDLDSVASDESVFEAEELTTGQFGVAFFALAPLLGEEPVDMQSAAEMLNAGLLIEGTKEALPPRLLEVDDELVLEVLIEDIDPESNLPEGGYYLMEREDGFYIALFYAAPDEYDLIAFTALMMLVQE